MTDRVTDTHNQLRPMVISDIIRMITKKHCRDDFPPLYVVEQRLESSLNKVDDLTLFMIQHSLKCS